MTLHFLQHIAAAGTSAIITVTFTHPIDLIKTRLQISGDNARNYKSLGINGTIYTIFKEEGFFSFWKGIQPALIRESTYTSLRIGLHEPIKLTMGIDNQSSFFMQFIAGSTSGAIASLVGNPFDVIKTRMMTVETHSHTFLNTIKHIYHNEKSYGFYKGIQANILRACVLNGTTMASYDIIQFNIKQTNIIPLGIPTQFVSAFGAGFFMALTVTPFDIIRTKLMKQTNNFYCGFIDCFIKIINQQGFKGLYTGFIPLWTRFIPTTCLQLILFEQIKQYYKSFN